MGRAHDKSSTEPAWDAWNHFPHPVEQEGRPLLIWISETQRGARFAREFETCQLRRTRIDILGERDRLKGAAQHLGVQQRLERACGLAISIGGLNSTA